jgi:hypothetical protein
MTFPVSIMEQFQKFPFPLSQLAWRRCKTASIGTVASVLRSKRIGNDLHVSHIKIDPSFSGIQLDVDSSSSQHISRNEQISSLRRTDPKDACVLENL